MAINYADGQTVETEIYQFLKEENNPASHIDLCRARYDLWPIRYHLSSRRANLVRPFNFDGLSVLELGAGMGGLSRYLAESCEFLHVVEDSVRRYDALKERLKDLPNWTGTVANIEDFSTSEKFDVVCLVGVLEYSEKYIQSRGQMSPFDVAMQIAKKHLNPGGALIVAIENNLGLKYWNGAAEDHTGRMFDSITGYDPNKGPKTFNRQQLLDLYTKNGFRNIEEFYPFPDYKVPMTVFHSSAFRLPDVVVAELACSNVFESYGNIRQPFYPDYLAMLEVVKAGLVPNMANSFLYVGFTNNDTHIQKVLLEKMLLKHQKVWHFTERAKGSVMTNFIQEEDWWRVKKSILIPWKEGTVSQWQEVNEQLIDGKSMRETLERAAYHHEWEIMIDELATFIKWLIEGKHYQKEGMFLADAVWQNARKTESDYTLFDQEWLVRLNDNKYEDFEGWVVFRNVITVGLINHYWSKTRPWRSLKELYESITERLNLPNNYECHLKNEALFQSDISGNTNVNGLHSGLNATMTKKRWRRSFLTSPQDWTTLTRYCSVYLSKLRLLQRLELKIRKLRKR